MSAIVNSASVALSHLRHLRHSEVEEFWVLALHSNRSVIAKECVFRGTVDACPVYPRDVFRLACRLNAASILVAHNHPSGDNRPSSSDLQVTETLLQAAQILQIPIVDHLIVTNKKYFSFLESGLIEVFGRTEQNQFAAVGRP